MLCLLRDIGQVILDPEVSDPNVRSAIFYRTPREKLQKAVEETGRMIRPADDSHFDFFARRYNYIRRFSPAFLGSITFHANTPYNSLLEAVDLLRDLDKKGPRRRVPDDAPLEFITEKKWRPYLFDREGRLSRRDSRTVRALGAAKRGSRAGNVWVENSRRYADLETYLIPPEQWSKLRAACLPPGPGAPGWGQTIEGTRRGAEGAP